MVAAFAADDRGGNAPGAIDANDVAPLATDGWCSDEPARLCHRGGVPRDRIRGESAAITIERGLFSKCYQDYHPKDIRSIDVDQTFFGRVLGIGDLTLSTAASSEGTEILLSIPNPQAVRELILAQRGNQ
jgi:hypothetical protein